MTAPVKPILALTLVLAGKREVAPEALSGLTSALALAFGTIGGRLGALRDPGCAAGGLASRFALERAARLTLITGLADGADQFAHRQYLGQRPAAGAVDWAIGAVLPCGRETFALHSPIVDRAAFDDAAAGCDFIVELDGRLPGAPFGDREGPPTTETRRIRRERADAFQAQAELLLRNGDILFAVDDPDDDGRPGGTRQTLGLALDQGLPVLLHRLGEPGLAILRARADLDSAECLHGSDAVDGLEGLVDELVGFDDPAGARHGDHAYAESLLREVFAPNGPTPGVLNGLWGWFEGCFKVRATSARDAAPPPYRPFRDRASALSAYYAGLYRGSFLLGYILAVVAVAMAVTSLAILLLGGAAGWPNAVVEGLLLVLGGLKFAAVFVIARLAERAKVLRLAHRAADYRYLSERLRAMIFLPHAGSLRTTVNSPLPHNTRVAALGVIDRLFLSIVRQVAPRDGLPGRLDGVVIQPDAAMALEKIRAGWLENQMRYHQANQQTHQAMKSWLDVAARRLNTTVVVIVAFDIGLILLSFSGLAPKVLEEGLHNWAAPVLIAIAAILPAAVASLNGVRFQSEASRLGDRSQQMAVSLAQLALRSQASCRRPPTLIEAMRLGDDVAKLTIDEVAEWSALYGKDFVEM
jgi:hypothetical protein